MKVLVADDGPVVRLQSALAEHVDDLERALLHVKQLQGILPICIHCHKVRNDREVWKRLEEYITENTDAMLSHSLCPACLDQHYYKYTAKQKNSPLAD